jgi:MarR family transcriptional regulator, organic hydroperoxide resistance regulator
MARAIRVALTEKGKRLIQNVAPALRAVNDRLFANMSSREMTTLDRLLRSGGIDDRINGYGRLFSI